MSRNYDWNTDKENKYDLDTNPARQKSYTATNNALRRKIDENITLADRDRNNQPQAVDLFKQQNFKIDQSTYGAANNKRDNARKRGFDMRVSNIESINDKIAGLLSMVKKDRATERLVTKDNQRFEEKVIKDRDITPRKEFSDKNKQYLKSNNASGKKYLRQEPKISKFTDPKVQEFQKKRVISVLQAEDSQTVQSQNVRQQFRMSYMQDERKRRENQAARYTPIRKKKQDDTSWVDQSFQKQSKRFEFKAAARVRQQMVQKPAKSQYEKMDIQKMIEQRRKQRLYYGENERNISPSVTQGKSQLKNREKQGQIRYNKHKESPILAVKNEFAYSQSFPQELPQSKASNSPSPAKGLLSRKSDFYNFSKLSYVEEEPFRQQRNMANTKIIDEQLNKIKNKIIQSQSNKKKIQNFNHGSSFQKENTKTHTCRIADSISSQVQYDSNLRAFRDTFCKMPGESKWCELQNIAGQKGLNLRGEHLRQLITIGPDQHNPFISEKSSISIQEFVTLLGAAQKNWEHCVVKCASGRSLKSENFQISDLDLSGKGYLALQDLVCFVNLYSNTFYRNRDLALVMRRLQMRQREVRKGGVEYQTFLQAFVS